MSPFKPCIGAGVVCCGVGVDWACPWVWVTAESFLIFNPDELGETLKLMVASEPRALPSTPRTFLSNLKVFVFQKKLPLHPNIVLLMHQGAIGYYLMHRVVFQALSFQAA